MYWLRLIRWQNLAIVFFTQLLVWYCLMYDPQNIMAGLQVWLILALAFSTTLIAAAGYIINDYFDIRIDMINRPDKVVLEKTIPLRAAIITHVALNIVALVLAAIVAAPHVLLVLVQLATTVLLWFYSTHFKKQYMVGNLVVAFLTALTVLLLVVYKPVFPFTFKFPVKHPAIGDTQMCYGYAFFAFMLTWVREIVKDMEDYKGDAEEGCLTMPIKKGLKYSQQFSQTLSAITIAVLLAVSVLFFRLGNVMLGIYTVVFIAVPLTAWIFFLQRHTTSVHYHAASRWLKIIMLAGLGSLLVYHFTNIQTSTFLI